MSHLIPKTPGYTPKSTGAGLFSSFPSGTFEIPIPSNNQTPSVNLTSNGLPADYQSTATSAYRCPHKTIEFTVPKVGQGAIAFCRDCQALFQVTNMQLAKPLKQEK